MRYFAHIQYNGAKFCGWQRQPHDITIQGELELTLSKVLRKETPIVGCGRTDTGVHASSYYFHFDIEEPLHPYFASKINGILPDGIVIKSFIPVADEAHARFDATSRSYTYHITRQRNPFRLDTSYHFPFYDKLNMELVKSAGQLLMNYEEFFPFCKTHSDVSNYKCRLDRCEWIQSSDKEELIFEVTANRYLRGMVRLIVGMCLNVGLGKITLQEVTAALETQTRLAKAHSVPPNGLFLSSVRYPYIRAGN
mgnify:CR=1 FL=1